MPGLNEQLKKINDARTAFKTAEHALYVARLSAQKTLKTDNFADLQQAVGGAFGAFETARNTLNTAIKGLFPQQGAYRTLSADLSAEYPVLFFPVRIETRFVDLPNRKQQLWVRIYPDDIHVHTHEPLLTDAEVTAGENYWKALAAANRMTEGDKEVKKQAAWQLLREYNGAQRSLWVVNQTKPKNWKPDLAVADSALQFPKHTETKTHSWTKPPHTQLLPDKFVISLYNGSEWFSHEGEPLPDTLYLGPDPFRAEQAIQKIGDNIVPHEDFAWATDFEKAVQNGMALRIDLKPEYFNSQGKIERLFATGILFSADPEKSQGMVEQMIENHHYSINGFRLVPQGTPTNNTEKDGSGYTRNEDSLPKGYFDGSTPSLFSDQPDCDGKIMADLFGIKGTALEEVAGAGMREHAEAIAMNTALYPATLGYFFGVALAPVIPETGLEHLRSFFTRHVTARGPLPAIRVGNQPYGLLLTSDQQHWGVEQASDAAFYNPLAKVFRELQKKWNELAAAKGVHVGMGGNPNDILLKVLGLQAGSVTFQQQMCSTFDFLLATSQGGNAAFRNNMLQKQQAIIALLNTLGFTPANEISYPQVSTLFLHPDFTDIPANNLVDGQPGSETRFLPADNYISWLAAVKTLDELEHLNFGDKAAPGYLLFVLLRHALLNELFGTTLQYYSKKGIGIHHGAFNKGLINFLPNHPDLTAWELMRGVPKNLDLPNFDLNEPLGEHFLGRPDTDPGIAGIAGVRSAMNTLAGLSTAHLERHLTDHIDLCTYRLDAWQTGLFYRKLEQKRASKPTGLYVGAFGWVNDLQKESRAALPSANIPEKLRPENGNPVFKLQLNAGFVHTPSLNHAAAAGLLLAGHHNHGLNYSLAAGTPKPFAVNLSSERVRRAQFIFEGVQNGQPLDALLGYQFERALHDITTANPANNLNQYIYDLREKFPVLRNTVPQQGAAEVQESVSAYPVINGLKLLESPDSDITGIVTNPGHATLVLKEKNRLSDTLDAANDLLVAETAYQASQGNTDRTAGVLNALRNAEVPPALEVLKTPRSSLLTYTNRATVHFRTDMSHQAGNNWTTKKSPRSVMETGLNRWLGRCIGHPAKVVCRVVQLDENGQERIPKTITLDDLQMHPIDFVYITGVDTKAGIGELEGRIAQVYRKKTNIEPTAPVKIYFDDPVEDLTIRTFAHIIPLARSLRTLVTTARAASARDFAGRSRSQTGSASLLYGWDAADLETRVKQALDDLKNKIFYIENKEPNEGAPPGAPATFKELFDRYAADGNNPELLELPLSDNGFDKISNFLRDASLFGIPLAFPDDPTLLSQPDLLAKAASTWNTMKNKASLAEKKIADALAETDVHQRVVRLTEAAKAVLGDDFLVLPRFRYSNPADMQQTLNDKTQLLRHISKQTGANGDLNLESWVQSAAHVRPDLGKLERVRMFTEALGGKLISIQPAQTPFRAKDSWLAVEFPEIYEPTGKPFQIYDDTIALALTGEAFDQVNDLQSALVVDEWTETIPTNKEVTGIAYHYNQPNAAPPQALLLAVEPTGGAHWNWDVLLGVLDDTLQRAKTRAVEPAHLLEDPVLSALLPMTLADYDVQQTNLALDYLVANEEFIANKGSNFALYAPFVKK